MLSSNKKRKKQKKQQQKLQKSAAELSKNAARDSSAGISISFPEHEIFSSGDRKEKQGLVGLVRNRL
jgi:flagellar motor protein MotB